MIPLAKLANYCVSAVRYNDKGDQILRVKVRDYNGKALGEPHTWARADMIKALDQGKSVATLKKSMEKKLVQGLPIELVLVKQMRFLRTDGNRTEKDVLQGIPEF